MIVGDCATAGGIQLLHRAADVLTAAEMEPWRGDDLYVVIQRLRPGWLQVHKAMDFTEVIPVSIIVDATRQEEGPPEALRDYRADEVEEVRFLDSKDATTLYGLNMMSGGIVITTRLGAVRL